MLAKKYSTQDAIKKNLNLNNSVPNILNYLNSGKDSSVFFTEYFNKLSSKISNIDQELLVGAAEKILSTHHHSKKIMIFGNGGSAAMASHIAVDFTKAVGVRSTNYNEADLITCLSNDFGYENWVSKAIEYYADSGDTIILISSSGTSQNIINGAKQAKKMSLPIITFSGFDKNNELRKLSNLSFWVDSNEYNIVEMAHHVWLVSIVDYIGELKLGKS